MATTAIRLPLGELSSEILPSDTAGGIEDLHGDSGSSPALTVPPVEVGTYGRGRVFADDVALIAAELTEGQTKLTRSVTIEALLTVDLSGMGDDDFATIVQRGAGGSSAERILWGLRIQRKSSLNALIEMRWQESDGTEAIVAGVEVQLPTGHFYLWARRIWKSTTESTVTIGANDVILATETVTESDIGGGAITLGDPAVYVGCSPDGSDYTDFLHGTLYALRVTNGERCDEELAAVFRRMTEHGPNGYAMIVGHQPDGPYSDNPDSIIQRELMVEGVALANAMTGLDELTRDGLIDRAWSQLSRWERVYALPPLPGDSIQTRRNRLRSFRRASTDPTPARIKAALTDVLDATAAQIEIIEHTNRPTDDFASGYGDAWSEFLGIDDEGAVSAPSAGLIQLALDSAQDGRWTIGDEVRLEQGIPSNPRDANGLVGVNAQVKLTAPTVPASDNHAAGIGFWGGASRDLAIFGAQKQSGDLKLTARAVIGGVPGSVTVIDATTWSSGDRWIRVRYEGGGDYRVWYGAADPPESGGSVVSLGVVPDTVGLVATRYTSGGGVLSMRFAEWAAYFPTSLNSYVWLAFRDSALGGSPDYAAANRIIKRLTQAHTYGAATPSRQFLAGASLIGREVL